MPKVRKRKKKKKMNEESKQKRINSKQKGGAFERKVCKLLSLWVSDNKRDDLYWRSAMSGGRASVRFKKYGKKSESQAGDISSIDPIGNRLIEIFAIECKNYDNLRYDSLLFMRPKAGTFVSCWEQTVETAKQHSKLPMLIAKQDQIKEIVICVDKRGLEFLENKVPVNGYLYSDQLEMYVFILEDFFYMFSLKGLNKEKQRVTRIKIKR